MEDRMGRMSGRVVLVTGAARGQGRHHALRFAQEGADVIAVDLCRQIDTVPYPLATSEQLRETADAVESLGRHVVAAEADVRDPEQLARVIDDAVDRLGGLDVVIANAGIHSSAPTHELTEQAWQDLIDVNLTGVWRTAKVSIPHLVRGGTGGSLVLVSSVAGLKGYANIAHYVTAKHGVIGLMRTMAQELAPHGIRVNCVNPTQVDTDMIMNPMIYKLFRPDLEAPTRADFEPASAATHLLPVPWIDPADVSNAALFLASDEARYITGVALPIDAGVLAK
jgi:(+)-trans-carveol dehydrogenase